MDMLRAILLLLLLWFGNTDAGLFTSSNPSVVTCKFIPLLSTSFFFNYALSFLLLYSLCHPFQQHNLDWQHTFNRQQCTNLRPQHCPYQFNSAWCIWFKCKSHAFPHLLSWSYLILSLFCNRAFYTIDSSLVNKILRIFYQNYYKWVNPRLLWWNKVVDALWRTRRTILNVIMLLLWLFMPMSLLIMWTL